MNLQQIEEAFDAASLDEFDIDPDAELFELSPEELADVVDFSDVAHVTND